MVVGKKEKHMDTVFVQDLIVKENILEHGTMDLRFLAFTLGRLAALILVNGRTENDTGLVLNNVVVGHIKANGHKDIKVVMDDERRLILVLIILVLGQVDFTTVMELRYILMEALTRANGYAVCVMAMEFEQALLGVQQLQIIINTILNSNKNIEEGTRL